jgi:hypothetical protein
MLGDKINKECLDCVSRLLDKVLKQKQQLKQAIESCFICKK